MNELDLWWKLYFENPEEAMKIMEASRKAYEELCESST